MKRTTSDVQKSDDSSLKGIVDNDHNRKEHEARLAREAERMKNLPPTAKNEHNMREHEEKIKREKSGI